MASRPPTEARHPSEQPGIRTAERTAERGAVLPLVVIITGVLFLAAALTIDIGRVASTNRDMQSVSDLAAIDSVRTLDGRASSLQQADVEAAAAASSLRNGFGGAGDSQVVELGTVDADGEFELVGPTETPNAVRVTSARDLEFMFIPGDRNLDRPAVASREGLAGFTIGSFAASLDASTVPLLNDTLGSQLGGPVNLDLVSYRGLADAQVTLGQLVAASGVGSASALLNMDLTMAQAITILSAAVGANGDSTGASPALAALLTAATGSDTVRLGDVLGIDASNASRLAGATFGVGEIVQGAAGLANGTNFINLANSVSVLGLADTTAKMVVTEAPQTIVGPIGSTVSTSQVRLYVTQELNVLGLGRVTLPLSIDIAQATGTLSSIECGSGSASEFQVLVDPSVARVRIGQLTNAQLESGAAPTEAELLNVLGLVRVTGESDTTIDSTTEYATFTPVYNNSNTVQVGSGGFNASLVSTDLSLSVNALGLLGLGFNVNTALLPAIDLMLASLTPLIDNIAAVNGLTVGGADVTGFFADCGIPALRS